MTRPAHHLRLHGFTLVELLVALLVMSILALVSWQGIDGMARSQAQAKERSDQVFALQTALLQWQTDLDNWLEQPPPAAVEGQAANPLAAKTIEFDGRVLRITRQMPASVGSVGLVQDVRVVAWGVRVVDTPQGIKRTWLRWVSDPVRNKSEWQAAWEQAGRWGQNAGDNDRARESVIAAIDEWQIFYFRNDSWSNPQSSDASGTQDTTAPSGVRLVLTLSSGQSIAGSITRDWASGTLGGGKS
jgi:general secretion pathway protein J